MLHTFYRIFIDMILMSQNRQNRTALYITNYYVLTFLLFRLCQLKQIKIIENSNQVISFLPDNLANLKSIDL